MICSRCLLRRGANPATLCRRKSHSASPTRASSSSGTPSSSLTSLASTTVPPFRDPTSRSFSPRKCELYIRAASPNTAASDFYRIAPKDLSAWRDTITSIHQYRDRFTFEPAPYYRLTFSFQEARTTYAERLRRMHRVARHKAFTDTALWESTVPPHLLDPNTNPADRVRDVTRLVEDYTINPASAADVYCRRHANSNSAFKGDRDNNLSAAVASAGLGPQPNLLLVTVSPSGLTDADLQRCIDVDGDARNQPWDVKRPIDLGKFWEAKIKTLEEALAEQRDANENSNDEEVEKAAARLAAIRPGFYAQQRLKARFALVFPSVLEAKRFHRNWNGRAVDGTASQGPERHRQHIYTSFVEW